MIILGALIATYGTCNGVSALAVPAEKLLEQSRVFSGGREPQFSPNTFRTMAVVFSALFLAVGIAHIAIGIPLRRGSNSAIISGMVLTIILGAFLLLSMLICVVAGLVMPIAFAGVCVLSIPGAFLVLQMIWLMQARRANANLLAMQMQYQQQFWQYQQQQQSYGYGYPQPPTPAPPANQQPPSMAPPPQGAGDASSTQR
jgi:hypothetical protein